MGFIPTITCRHCGNKYSAIHSRCPSCGTRRVKPTTHSAPTTASTKAGTAAAARATSQNKWQFIFGCILVVAVIVAVIILISASFDGSSKDPVETPEPPAVTTPPPTTPPPTPTPEPTIPVTSVTITFLGDPLTEFTQRPEWAAVDLNADVYPVEALEDAELTWRSSDEAVCTVDEEGFVTAVGSGSCEIIAECGGIAAKCNVLVP